LTGNVGQPEVLAPFASLTAELAEELMPAHRTIAARTKPKSKFLIFITGFLSLRIGREE